MMLRAVSGLIQVQPEPFILMAASLRNRTPAVENLLRSHRSIFVPLAGALILAAAKKFKTGKSIQPLLERFADQAGVGATGILPQGKTSPEYLIRQEGTRQRAGKQDRTMVSTWRIFYGGSDLLLPTKIGSEYLVYLLGHQGREYDSSRLTENVRKSALGEAGVTGTNLNEILYGGDGTNPDADLKRGRVGDADERDVVWSQREINETMEKIDFLQEEIDGLKSIGEGASEKCEQFKEKLKEQRELLKHNAKQVRGKWIPVEYQKGTAKEKAELIGKHLRELLNGHIRDHCRPLYEHLSDKKILKFGIKNSYQPHPKVPWTFEFKQMKKGR